MLLTLIAPTGIRFPVECSAKDSLHSVLESFLASHPEFRQTRGELQLRREKNPQSMLSLECRAEEFQGDDNSILVVIVDSQENNLPELELVEELQEITDNDEVDVGVDPFAGKLFVSPAAFPSLEVCI